MKKSTIEQLKKLSILEIADRLNIQYSPRGKHRQCLCFLHDDHNPSMWLTVGKNTWKCPVCNRGGDNIALVMAHQNLSFPEAAQWLMNQFNIEEQKDINSILRQQTKTNPMTTENTALQEVYKNNNYRTDSTFCTALLSNKILTPEQVQHAAIRYHLGKSREGGVIYWMIDRAQTVLDGKVMFYCPDCHRDHAKRPFTVVSWLVKEKRLPDKYNPSRCLFGLHLVDESTDTQGIAIVESEKTAIICSEIFPQYTWLATGGMSNLTTALLSPLRNKKIILFPDTDPDGTAYNLWKQIAIEAAKTLKTGIMVSSYLERKATPTQKQAKIDLADFFISPS